MGGRCTKCKVLQYWEGVLLSENLGWGWGSGNTEGSRRFQRSGFCFAVKDGEKEYKEGPWCC